MSEGFDAGAGGGVHDCAAPMLQHQRDLVLHTQEHAVEVDGDDRSHSSSVTSAVALGFCSAPALLKGDVETPERADCLVQHSLHILGPRHVATDGESPAAEFFDPAGCLLVALVGQVGQHDPRTFPREG